MSNAFYPSASQAFLEADIDMSADTIRAVLVDTALYSYSAADIFLSAIPVGARVATSIPFTGKTTLLGVFNAASGASFPAFLGATVEAIVVYQDTGVAGTSRLIAYWDTGVTGLPLTPDGSPAVITWTPYIFRIAGTCS